MTPERLRSLAMTEVSAREVWWAFVVAGFRSRVGLGLLILGLSVCIWQFLDGHLIVGLALLAYLVFTYGCVPGAIGAAMGARSRREHG
jgi:hypothetical protein